MNEAKIPHEPNRGEPSAAKLETKESELERELHMLQHAIEGAQEDLMHLGQKLMPVLRDVPPSPGDPIPDLEEMSTRAGNVASLRVQVCTISVGLRNLLDRLEV